MHGNKAHDDQALIWENDDEGVAIKDALTRWIIYPVLRDARSTRENGRNKYSKKKEKDNTWQC